MANAGTYKKGEKRPNQGRPKGLLNKNTAALKDMILGALEAKGGIEYLVEQADTNPNAFMSLVGKVLPLTVQGPGGNGEHSLVVEITRFGSNPSA